MNKKLKTLKDLKQIPMTTGKASKMYENQDDPDRPLVVPDINTTFTYAIDSKELRQAAIDWIQSKELQCSEGDNHTKEWIRNFFNIKGEEL